MSQPEAKTWTPDQIVEALNRSEAFVGRAVYALYERQTRDEQDAGVTVHHNKVGFSGCDAEILSSFARFWKKTGFLTPKQVALARKKLPKYRKQLAAIAAEKAAEKQAPAPAPAPQPPAGPAPLPLLLGLGKYRGRNIAEVERPRVPQEDEGCDSAEIEERGMAQETPQGY